MKKANSIVNLKTKSGATLLLQDIQKQLKETHYQSDEKVKGLKSIYYHRNKVKDLLAGLQSDDKDIQAKALQKTEKYITFGMHNRGNKHRKNIGITMGANNQLTYKRVVDVQGSKTTGNNTHISFYEFVEIYWSDVKDIVWEYTRNSSLNALLYNSSEIYKGFRDRLSNELGFSWDDLIEHLKTALYIYRNFDFEFIGIYETNNFDGMDNYMSYWGHPSGGMEHNDEYKQDYLNFIQDAKDVGIDVEINNFME